MNPQRYKKLCPLLAASAFIRASFVRQGWLILLAGLLALWARPVLAQSPVANDHEPVPAELVVLRIDFVDTGTAPAVTDRQALLTLTERLDIWEVQYDQETSTTGDEGARLKTRSRASRRGHVIAAVTQAQWEWLTLLGYETALDQARTDKLRSDQGRLLSSRQGIPNYTCYRTVEETYSDLAGIAADHANLATWIDIGDSYDKTVSAGAEGHDLFALVLTNKSVQLPKGKLLVLAAVHARELTTAELATRFAERLVASYGTDPDATWLLDYNEIHIIAQGNPDGRTFAEQGYYWRKNTNNPSACGFPYYGVDLNRNSAFLWNGCVTGCSSADPCNITYRGVAPASEPETQAIESYIDDVFPDQRGEALGDPAPLDTVGVFLSLHSYGNLVIYPWDWTGTDAPNMEELRRMGRKFGYFNGYGVCNTQNCLYPIDGSNTDYAYGEKGVATYTVEMGTQFFQSCSYFENNMVESNLQMLFYAAKAAWRPYRMPAGPDTLELTVSPQVAAPGGHAENATVTVEATVDGTRYDSNGYGTEPVQMISDARYSVDAPPWLSQDVFYLDAADGQFDSVQETITGTVDTTGWPTGRHTLFVQGQDANGEWGVPTATFLWVNRPYDFELHQSPPIQFAAPGQQVTYTLTVTNVGSLSDTVAVNIEEGEWALSGPQTTPAIPPLAQTEITLTTMVPTTATIGTAHTFIVELVSGGDANQVRVATLEAIVIDPLSSIAEFARRRLYIPLLRH